MQKRRTNLFIIWSVSFLISVSLPVGAYFVGKAGDCRPGEIDGQCGMSTFFSVLYGIASGLVIQVSMTVYVLIESYRRRKRRQETIGQQGS